MALVRFIDVVSNRFSFCRLRLSCPGTPAEIVNNLNKDPKMKARLADLGSTVLAGSPHDFGKLITDETEKWAKVIRFAGIKPE